LAQFVAPEKTLY